MDKFENAIEMLVNNNITYTIKYKIGKYYKVSIFFDELGYMPTFTKVYDYNTGRLLQK
jgi:hypothetical protein